MSDADSMRTPVLIVEDDFEVREALAQVLLDEGYDVESATDGADALAKLRGNIGKPSLIILDLWMPRMDGFAFRAAQLASEETADIPVVVVTAAGVAPNEMARLGLTYVLRKPVDLQILLRVVRRTSTSGGPRLATTSP
jgi:CheY-like chemotaxis protein